MFKEEEEEASMLREDETSYRLWQQCNLIKTDLQSDGDTGMCEVW